MGQRINGMVSDTEISEDCGHLVSKELAELI